MIIKSAFINTAIALVTCFSALAQKSLWTQPAGGTSSEHSFALASDQEGNIYVTGGFQQGATFDKESLSPSGDTDIFLAKYSPTGKLIWIKQAGSPYRTNNTLTEYGTDVMVVDDQYVYVSGIFRRTATFEHKEITSVGQDDIFLAKYSLDGQLLWVKSAGGVSEDVPHAMTHDQKGNVYLTGYFQHTATFSPRHSVSAQNASEFFITKYAPDGRVVWVNHSASDRSTQGKAIACVGNHLYVAGNFSGDVSIRNYRLSSGDDADIFLAQYDLDGQQKWIQQIGGPGEENINAMVVQDDYLYFTGSFTKHLSYNDTILESKGKTDILLGKYSTSGQPIWLTSAGGSQMDEGNSLVLDESGNVMMTGSFQPKADIAREAMYGQGFTDILIASYEPEGRLQWHKSIGGKGKDIGIDILSQRDEIILTGSFWEEASLDKEKIASQGASDILLAKFKSPNLAYRIPAKQEVIQIYPNPADDIVQVTANLPTAEGGTLQVINATGAIVREFELKNQSILIKKIKTEDYPVGAYYIQIRVSGNIFTKKLLIAR